MISANIFCSRAIYLPIRVSYLPGQSGKERETIGASACNRQDAGSRDFCTLFAPFSHRRRISGSLAGARALCASARTRISSGGSFGPENVREDGRAIEKGLAIYSRADEGRLLGKLDRGGFTRTAALSRINRRLISHSAVIFGRRGRERAI